MTTMEERFRQRPLEKRIEALKAERDRLQYELDAVPAIKAERDALTSDNASLHRQLSQWHLIAIERAKERDDANERAFMSTESHAMTMQRAMEAEEERDDAWLQNTALDARCAKLEAERDALAAAGKLALEALVAESRTTESNVTLAQILTAITALRQAGVQ